MLRRIRVTIVLVEGQQVLNIECFSVALDIQHAKRIRPIAIYGFSGPTTFFSTISQTAPLSGKNYRTHEDTCNGENIRIPQFRWIPFTNESLIDPPTEIIS